MNDAPRNAIRGILFDKDGTLLDYEASWQPITRDAAALAARGDEALARKLLAIGGADPDGGNAIADSLLAAGSAAEIAAGWVMGGAPFTVVELTEALDALFTKGAQDVVPVCDLAALLGRFRARGYRLGIASSDSEAAIRATAERFGLLPLLDYIAGYDSGHGGKPGPGMVHGFCRATGLAAGEIAVVGDNLHDIAMARAAGAGLAVGVLTGTGTRALLGAQADCCLASIEMLEFALDAHGDGDIGSPRRRIGRLR